MPNFMSLRGDRGRLGAAENRSAVMGSEELVDGTVVTGLSERKARVPVAGDSTLARADRPYENTAGRYPSIPPLGRGIRTRSTAGKLLAVAPSPLGATRTKGWL